MTTATRQLNKARKALSNARLDFWEAGYLCGEKHMRKAAKRTARKACRAEKRAHIAEGMAD